VGSGAGTALIVIVVVLAAAFFIIPTLDIPGLDQIIASIKQLFGGGGVADGFAAVSFKVYFTDGSTELVPDTAQFCAVQYGAVSFNNKEITKIDVYVNAKLNGSQVTVWNTNSSVSIELYKGAELTPKFSSTSFYVQTGSAWVSNSVKNLATVTLQENTLNGLMNSYGSGMWLLQVKSNVKLSATIAGKLTDFDAQTPSGGLNINLVA
jgi:hypothetical protein